MESSKPPSSSPSRSSTPNAAANTRFAAPKATAEDLFREQTVGLVNLSDYRKRRVEAIEKTGGYGGTDSGASTPRDGALTPKPVKKKARKNAAKGKLSFGLDEEDEVSTSSANPTPRSGTPISNAEPLDKGDSDSSVPKKKLGPNANVTFKPKILTKSALLKEAQAREQLRKEFLAVQETVKATEIVIPFVFYDGTNIPGGTCRVKKGDHVWFFLDKARKVGAELGVGGDNARKSWARISVDDLMLVRGEIIVPPHFEFYYFLINKTIGFHGQLFSYSAEPTAATPKQIVEPEDDAAYDPLSAAKQKKERTTSNIPDEELEGYNDDASLTKVVDRRWYEKNKHVFPASVWEDFDVTKDYSKGIRKDASGNSFFFS